MSADRLYTPEMLAAAVELANVPPIDDAPLHGSARSPACGSTLDMDVVLDESGSITRLGMKVRACAVGQAAAAIFARHANARNAGDIDNALRAFGAWLEGDGPEPDWPDISLVAPARDYRGRHGAMLLPWKAAMSALSSTDEAG